MLQLTEVIALCNEAHLSLDQNHGTYSIIGEPTESALRVLVEKLGTPNTEYNALRCTASAEQRLHFYSKYYEKQAPKHAVYEFSRDRKSMSVLVKGKDKRQRLLVKGAPESIIERCSHALVGHEGKKLAMNKRLASLISQEVIDYGNSGLRVIAIASTDDI